MLDYEDIEIPIQKYKEDEMPITSIHDFHFIMDRGMKNRLNSLNLFKKSKSLSGILVRILQLLTPVIGKEHKWGKQRMSKYAAVCNDPEEIREHVHIYVPDELYRELKLLHQDLNFYSIAQLVRVLVNFFWVWWMFIRMRLFRN